MYFNKLNQQQKILINIIFFTLTFFIFSPLYSQTESIGAGKSIDFLGKGHFAKHNHSNLLALGNTGSIEAWIQATSHKPYAGIVHKGDMTTWGDENYSLQFWGDDGTLCIAFGENLYGGNQLLLSNTKLQTGKMYHVTATWDSDVVRLYINGYLDAETNNNFTFHNTQDSKLIIGSQLPTKYSNSYKNFPFDGYIDEVRIWGATLSENEIREWMCKQITSSHPQWANLRANYRFDEINNSDLNVYDFSPNNLHCTISYYLNQVVNGWQRNWSFFPLGNNSAYIANSISTGVIPTLNLTSSLTDNITLSNIVGTYKYLSIIEVTESPNYTNLSGADELFDEHYWHVWSDNNTAAYTMTYNYSEFHDDADETTFRLLKRENALDNEWDNSNATQDQNLNTFTLTDQSLSRQYILGGNSTSAPTGNYYVRTDGDNSKDGRTPQNAWKTIKYAGEQSLEPGDTVFIAEGIYTDMVTIKHSGTISKPIVYIGDKTGEYFSSYAGAGEILLDVNGSNNGIKINKQNDLIFRNIDITNSKSDALYIYTSANIEIDNFNISNSKKNSINCYKSTDNIKIKNCNIINGKNSGIYINNSNTNISLSIINNTIENHTYGIFLNNSNADSLCYNTITNMSQKGIYTRIGKNINIICNNNISHINHGHGMFFNSGTIGEIINNQLYEIDWEAIFTNSVGTINKISNNTINNMWRGNGMLIRKGNVGIVNNNIVTNVQKDGIDIDRSSAKITNNLIHDTWDDGINIKNPSALVIASDNIIYKTNHGIDIQNGTKGQNHVIQNNTIHTMRNGNGIEVKNVEDLLIKNNLIYNAKSIWESNGINIKNSNKIVNIINNTIYKSGKNGIKGNTVTGIWKNNIISGHNGYGFYGISVKNSDPILSYNCLYDNNSDYDGISAGFNSIFTDPLFVDIDGSDNTMGGDNGSDDDFHIQSEYGSYHFGSWTTDAITSPCLDTGDPNDDFSNEPDDNGDRINIGCYGNTDQASLSGNNEESYTYTIPGSTWVLIGPPVQPTNSDPMQVYGDDFGGEMPFDNNHWSFIRWQTEDYVSEYYEFGDGTEYQPANPTPGIGHFLWQDYGDPVIVDVKGTPVEEDVFLSIAPAPEADWNPPAPGLNMFANPFIHSIDWSNTKIRMNSQLYSLTSKRIYRYISGYAYKWDYINGQYELIAPQDNNTDRIDPWEGFWFVQRTKTPENLELNIPYLPNAFPKKTSNKELLIESIKNIDPKFNIKPASTFSEWEWFLKLSIFSEDNKLSDTENGIGVTDGAEDGEDGWDAFEFNSMNREFVKLSFPHENGRLFTYDIKNIFEDYKDWTFQVSADENNNEKKFKLMWPFLRTVPGNIQFSLYDEQETQLIENLSDHAMYSFELNGSIKKFKIRASVITDIDIPECKFMFTQNFIVENDITIFIIPNEPVSNLTATLNNNDIELTQLSHNSNIYYTKHFLSENGSLNINAEFTDYAGNVGNSSTTMNFAKAIINKAITINTGTIELKIPDFAIDRSTKLTLCSQAIDITEYEKMNPVSDPIKIGPDNLKFTKEAKLIFGGDAGETEANLYQYKNGQWYFIEQNQKTFQIDETGIYQLFSNNSPNHKTSDISAGNFQLHSIYPNPFNAETSIKIQLLNPSKVSVKIYNLLGEEIRTLFNSNMTTGYHIISWNGNDKNNNPVPSGIYFVKIQSNSVNGNLEKMEKITYLK